MSRQAGKTTLNDIEHCLMLTWGTHGVRLYTPFRLHHVTRAVHWSAHDDNANDNFCNVEEADMPLHN